MLTKRNLPVYGVSSKSLKDFLTSEKDQLRHITRMPSMEFRMWEIDLVPEKRPTKVEVGGDQEFDDITGDLYDDFVLIERQM